MIVKFYKYTSNLLLPLIFFYFVLRVFFSKENRNSLLKKFGIGKIKRPNGRLVWINGVSIGEAKSGISIAKEILKNNPNTTILFTTSTLTAFKIISDLKNNFIITFTPLDVSFIVKRFIKFWKPDITIFMESEIWPNIISELKNNNIHFSILNGRISKKSYFFWKKISFFSKEIFSKINFCFVQNQESKNRFECLGVPTVKLISNLKFLNDYHEIDRHEYLELKKILSKKLVVTLFSSHEEEELVLIDCYSHLKKQFPNVFFVIIPRHVNKKNQIMLNLKNHNINFALRSKDKHNIYEKNFYIADTYGELNLFFKLSHVAIVGGSFKKIGGHNPIEISNYDCVLFFGPEMFNFNQIKELILKKKAGFEANNHKDLAKKISIILNNKKLKKQTINNFKNLCREEALKVKKVLKSFSI